MRPTLLMMPVFLRVLEYYQGTLRRRAPVKELNRNTNWSNRDTDPYNEPNRPLRRRRPIPHPYRNQVHQAEPKANHGHL